MVDEDYRAHQQAYLTVVAKAEKKSGKPVYKTFKSFFDYEEAIKKALDEPKKTEARFASLSKYLSERGD
jgi:hypothetical protein|nr:MAG TPA: hypothetical protein [Caudoviricetes sp.]